MKKIALLTFLCIFVVTTKAQSIEKFVKQFAKIERSTTGNGTEAVYKIMFKQPVDHADPSKGYFLQRLWLTHKDPNAPMVIVTAGYTMSRSVPYELTGILQANQLIVEHRYFGESKTPENDWNYLTIEQAAKDHHAIIEQFKQFYKSKWISTGVSKGGSTCLFHRAFFPDDVTLSVPYVAPLNFAREDQRLFDFFHLHSDAPQRQALKDFQRLVLEKRDSMIPKMKAIAERYQLSFKMGFEKAFELAVMEYPFAFMQWGHNLDEIPTADASDDEIFRHFMKGSDFSYFSDATLEALKPFFYQAYAEFGYYAYVPGDLKPLMKAWPQDTISSSVLLEKSDTITFNANTLQYVMVQLRKNNPKIIAIVGETDPWGATAIEAPELSNTIKLVQPEGSHKSRIKSLPPYMQQRAYQAFSKWLDIELKQTNNGIIH